MYLYVVSLHPWTSDAATAAATNIGNGIAFNVSTRATSNLQLRSDPPISTESHAPKSSLYAEYEAPQAAEASTRGIVIGIQFLFRKTPIPIKEDTLAAALEAYYRTLFGKFRFVSDKPMPAAWHIRAKCIELPFGSTEEDLQSTYPSVFGMLGDELLLEGGNIPFNDGMRRIKSGFRAVPECIRQEAKFTLFCAHMSAKAASKRLEDEWQETIGPIAGLSRGLAAGYQDSSYASFGDAGIQTIPGREAKPPPAPTYIYRHRELLGTTSESRGLLSYLFSSRQSVNWTDAESEWRSIIFPCSFTPLLGTELCSEIEVKEIRLTDTTQEYFKSIEGLVMPVQVLEELQQRVRAVQTTVTAVRPPPAAPVAAPVAAGPLDPLWNIFKTEYIELDRPERGSTQYPQKFALFLWKSLCMNPKNSPLHDLPIYEDSLVGDAPLPRDWSSVGSAEAATEFFYAKVRTENMPEKVYLHSRLIGGYLSILFGAFYGFSICDSAISEKLEGLDYSPLLEFLVADGKHPISESTRVKWVEAFARHMLAAKEGKSLGSTEVYESMKGWIQRLPCSSQSKETFLAGVPIAEFTRIMKMAGFEMTRRAKGMVYVDTYYAQQGDIENAEKMEKTKKMMAEWSERNIPSFLVEGALIGSNAIANATPV
jgi:hypothetical protein